MAKKKKKNIVEKLVDKVTGKDKEEVPEIPEDSVEVSKGVLIKKSVIKNRRG